MPVDQQSASVGMQTCRSAERHASATEMSNIGLRIVPQCWTYMETKLHVA